MNTVQKNRLLKLAAFLIALPKQKFNYGLVAQEVAPEHGGKPMLEALAAKKESCGTVACAMGWTPALFPRLVRWTNTERIPGEDTLLDVCLRAEPDVDRNAAMRKLFGISESQVEYLFYPETNWNGLSEAATAKEVGAHIKRFVKWEEERVAKLKTLERAQKSAEKLAERLDAKAAQLRADADAARERADAARARADEIGVDIDDLQYDDYPSN